MGMIHILPEKIANKIAAGEVIERPASIVKELVENALDAGADVIEITVGHGGRSLVRVADNGCGMNAEDAELAFKRHATSKIREPEDLGRILSFGFRGEALPSIAAVSRTRLMTRPKGAMTGTEVLIEGGGPASVSVTSCREGTVVEIRDLFFNTPARRKFLRSETTEKGHVMDVVARLALAHLNVHFTLKEGRNIIYDFLPGEDLRSRATKIFGEETCEHLLELNYEAKGVKLSGLIGKPLLRRANRTDQVFFVNRRWVKSPALSYALQAAYHGLLMHGQYPVAVLFVEVDPARVDVNVHPTKQEVRISAESSVKNLLKETVRQRLQLERDLVPEPSFTPPVTEHETVRSGTSEYRAMDQQDARLKDSYGRPKPFPTSLGIAEPPLTAGTAETSPLTEPIGLKTFHVTKLLGQIHNTFILAETQEGYIVVDQHAAHERVMFETLLKGLKTGRHEVQNLLMEEVLEVHPRRVELLREALPFLTHLGFDLDAFGENTFVLRAYPAVFKTENPLEVVKEFLDQMEEGHLRTSLENHQENVAALIACKRRSIKARDSLTHEEIKALLEALGRCDNPYNCPHGRPTFFKQTFVELEKQFKRK